uniref:Zinc finger and SCAN domain-containing protein 2 n=1 Tax=Lygus hesperus TaxID=30085 RepID=A0A0A9YE69_LYGHE
MLSALRKTGLKEDGSSKPDHAKKKEYPCFLCNAKSSEKGIPLLVSQTTFSRICLGEKLQEILGEKFIVLITSKDAICWKCAKYINWVDKCERKLDLARGNILNMVVTKYKNAEMDLTSITPKESIHQVQSGASSSGGHTIRSQEVRNYKSGNMSDFIGGYEKSREDKKKTYECHICLKVFASPAALGVHKARQHPIHHVCDYCGMTLSTEAKYKAHLAKHVPKTAPIASKMLNCVLCGFQTRNMETYCRHACDSKIVSLVCTSCRKRYIHNKTANHIPGKNLCPDCLTVEGAQPQVESVSQTTQQASSSSNQYAAQHLHQQSVQQLSHHSSQNPTQQASQNVSPKNQSSVKQEETILPEVDDVAADPLAMDVEHIVDSAGTEMTAENMLALAEMNPDEIAADLVAVVDPENLHNPDDDSNHYDDPTSTVEDENQGETVILSSDLHTEMPEFFRPPQEKRLSDQSMTENAEEPIENAEPAEGEGELILPVDSGSLFKCASCHEEFDIDQVATHPCFINADADYVEGDADSDYIQIPVYDEHQETLLAANGAEVIRRERRVNRRRIPKIPAQENAHYTQIEPETKMHCKTCYAEFRTIGLMRQHWDLTGHSREVSTTTIELNKIKDKNNKTEQTFKVVKQNFNIRANVVGQNDEDIRRTDEQLNNCIIKVKESPTIEEFMLRREGKMCNACGVIFGDEELLVEHQCNNCLTCVACHITFMDSKLLKKHYQYTGHASKLYKRASGAPESPQPEQVVEHPVVVPYYCPKCNKTFPARPALRKHLRSHYKGTTGGACHYCLLEFEDKSDIQQHVLEAHGAYLYKCDHCDKAFLTKTVRNKHQMKHIIHKCQVCNVKFANQRLLIVHMDKVHRSKACRLCGKMITDLYALRRHERRHFYDNGLKCDFCDKSFRNKSSLKVHNRLHDGEPQYRCKTCQMGFKTPRSLEDHEIVHIKKQYTCTKCSTVCPSKNFYWLHMKMHDLAYKCSVCGRMFRDTSLLAIHKRKHFRARPYQCPRCPRVFSVPATLRRHLTVHTRTFPFKCGLCKKGFLTKYAYHKHLDTVHAVRNTQPRRILNRIPSLPLNATDEDLLHAADTFISDDVIMFNEYQKDVTIEQVPSSDMITEEVIVETTELFDEILH